MGRPFHIVDVFAEKPYAGNPLAVVLETDELPESAMQAIAAETNYSETAFVATDPDPDGAFRVRLFTSGMIATRHLFYREWEVASRRNHQTRRKRCT